MIAYKKRRLSSLGLGLLIGLLGALCGVLPPTAGWEESVGLSLLFNLRGERPPPEEVAIVSINAETAAQLGLGEEIPQWPRTLHAQLIDRLREAGVAVIAIDIFFKQPREPEMDDRLAASIARAGNVLLIGYLNRQRISAGGQTLQIEELVPPIDQLADAATYITPFVLPKVPVRVSRFWTFNGDNALPSMPMVALLHLADPDGSRFSQLLNATANARSQAIARSDRIDRLLTLRHDPALRDALGVTLASSDFSPKEQRRLQRVLQLTGSEANPYLNLYGPPATLSTIPYQEILKMDSESVANLRGKVVFIGYSGNYQPRQMDGFYTVFSQSNGLDLSGVEIAATAFANLLHGETLSPLSPPGRMLLLTLYGLAVTLLLRHLPGSSGIVTTLFLALAFLSLSYWLFTRQHIWLPLFTPLVLQTPLAMILVLSWHYRQIRHSREQLRELFGYYLPGDVIDQLAEDKELAMEQSDKAFGVCLASDARQYTSLAEHMEPDALQTLLNRYYEILFAPVRRRNGVVSDVIGDAMLAIWPATEANVMLRQHACEAALEIVHALSRSNLEPPLPTGIGLHAGELVMSHVGAIDHFEYRAVGDIVNTSNRIETMNKTLGTQILASQETLIDLQGIVTRELGAFMLAGRQQPITLHEVVAFEAEATPDLHELHQRFGEALAVWKSGKRAHALGLFEEILRRYPHDGPSSYYVQQYRERRSSRINPLN
ncbi:MAG: adenylate/guanylate cyclase domain-containing protein [Candidatus Thiodiazotropha sp.]